MFDPKKMVSPLTALKDEVSGNLSKVLLNEDNTVVKSVRRNNAYHNTAAVINTIDASGALIREDRELLYDRINLEEHIKKFSKFHREDDGDVSYALLTDTVSETVRNVDALQLADVLKNVHLLPIDDNDLMVSQKNTVEPIVTPFGRVFSSVNCVINNGLVTYRGGTTPVPVLPAGFKYFSKTVSTDIQPGFSIIREWIHGEKLELTLPNMSVADDWRICIESVDSINYNSQGKLWSILSLDSDLNAWEVYTDGAVKGYFDAVDANVISISLVDGILKLNGKANDTLKVDILGTEPLSTASQGLMRMTVFTRNPSRQEIQINMGVKKPAANYKPVVSGPTETVGIVKSYDRYMNRIDNPALNFGITANSKLDDLMMCAMVWDINDVDAFDLRIFNRPGDGGDYSGLSSYNNGGYLLITDRNNYIEKVKTAIATNFTYDDVIGISYGIFNDEFETAYVNSVKVVNETISGNAYSSFKLTTDKLTNTVSYEILYGPPESPEEAIATYTGDIVDKLNTFENPIVLLVTTSSAVHGDSYILSYGIESTPLPAVVVEVNPTNVNNLISANPASNALIGGLTLPVAITNTLCSGYVEHTKNTFKSAVKSTSSGVGSITKLISLNNLSGDSVVTRFDVREWSSLVKSLNMRQAFIEVVNAADVTDTFRVEINVLGVNNFTLTTYLDGLLVNTIPYTPTNGVVLSVSLDNSEMSINYTGFDKIINESYAQSDGQAATKFRVEFGLVVSKRTTLPTITVSNNLILGDGGQS